MQHRREWAFALVMSAAHGAQHFFSRLVPPLIPILLVALERPLWQLGLLVTVFELASGFTQAPVGELADRYDRRYVLAPGIGVLAAGYVLFGLAPTVGAGLPSASVLGSTFDGTYLVMLVAMVVGGAGASVTHPTGYPLISANVGEARKGRALGMWGSAAKLGDAAAPAAVAVLILVLAWHQVAAVLGLLGLAFGLVLFAVLSTGDFETTPPAAADDGGEDGGETADVWGADPRVFVYPMLAILLFFAARMVTTTGVNTFVPAFIVDVYGYSLAALGVELAPESFANFYFSALLLTAAAVQLVTGGLTDRFEHRKVLVGFLAVTTVALAVLSFVSLGPLPLLVVLLVVGGGLWGLNPARDALVSDITPAEYEGRTFGYLWTVAQVIGAASPVFIGYVAGITGIQDSFRYLALTTGIATVAIALLFSERVYDPGAADDAAGPAD